jgi:hypothetical protein
VIEVLYLAMSENCAESAIYRSDFIFHGRGGHYVFHTNQFLPSLRPSDSVNHTVLCQVCEWEVPVDGAITELDTL